MTRFLHITDLHLTVPDPGSSDSQTPSADRLIRLVELVNDLDPLPEFAVISGDLTDLGDLPSYRLCAQILDGLKMPAILALGNHDKRPEFYQAFPTMAGRDPMAPLDHDHVIGGIHIIALDSSVAGRVSGDLSDDQIAKLTQKLEHHPDLPKLITVHHPPNMDPANTQGWASLNLQATRALGDAIAGHNVSAILSGHIHVNRVTLWNGAPVVTTMGQDSIIDATRRAGLTLLEGAGFAICDYSQGQFQVNFIPLEERRVIKEISDDHMRSLP